MFVVGFIVNIDTEKPIFLIGLSQVLPEKNVQ